MSHDPEVEQLLARRMDLTEQARFLSEQIAELAAAITAHVTDDRRHAGQPYAGEDRRARRRP